MTVFQKWIASGLAGCVLLVLAVHLKNHDPESEKVRFMPCVLRKVTGFHCPGCGSTRAAHALLNRDLGSAWRKNPAFVISLPFILFGFTYSWLNWISPRRARPVRNLLEKLPASLPYVVIAAFVLFGILRNLPMSPFSALAPH